MTKSEAIQAMERGEKVTHRYFGEGEYLYMQNNVMYTEEGYECSEEFWELRAGWVWETDWEIFTATVDAD